MVNRYSWDHYVYSQMLHLLYEYHSSETALRIIMRMRENHMEVTHEDYMDAIRVCSVMEDSDKIAIKLWNYMLSEGHSPTLIDYEVLMNCFIRSNSIDSAEKLFETIRAKGLKPTVWTYNTLLGGYKRTGSWERALQIYQVMKLDSVTPDGITYLILIELLLKEKHADYAGVIVRDLQGGKNHVDAIVKELHACYVRELKENVNLMDSNEFLNSFDRLFGEGSLKESNFQFTHLFLKKSYLNSLFYWYIHQDDRLAILYLYRCTLRSRKTAANDLTYRLLFYYCGVKQDSAFYELIMKNAVMQGFTYNVAEWGRCDVGILGERCLQVLLAERTTGEGSQTDEGEHSLQSASELPNTTVPT